MVKLLYGEFLQLLKNIKPNAPNKLLEEFEVYCRDFVKATYPEGESSLQGSYDHQAKCLTSLQRIDSNFYLKAYPSKYGTVRTSNRTFDKDTKTKKLKFNN